MPIVIEVDRLNLTYGDFHAVKDFSLEVRSGELYALLGTNGAGRTIGRLTQRTNDVDRVLDLVDLTDRAGRRCHNSPAGRSGAWISPPPSTAPQS